MEEARPEKPFGNKFCQQQMTHYYSHVSAQPVILCLFIVGVVFIPVGAATLIASESIYENDVRYDTVHSCTYASNQGVETFATPNGTQALGCITNVKFTLSKALVAPVYIYYRLKGFNQNYRLYAASLNDAQLSGRSYTRSNLDSCKPFVGPDDNHTYAPCGSVAWSMFNDTISLYQVNDTAAVVTSTTLPPASQVKLICQGDAFDAKTNQQTQSTGCEKDGIAFSQDVKSRFSATIDSDESIWTGEGFNASDNVYHQNGWYNNEPGHKIPLVSDQDFMVWSRIATLSDFRKLYRKITVDLPAGTYVWNVLERFDTTSMGAEKHIVLTTVSWVGGKNQVLGALFITMGALLLLQAFGFIGMYIARNKE